MLGACLLEVGAAAFAGSVPKPGASAAMAVPSSMVRRDSAVIVSSPWIAIVRGARLGCRIILRSEEILAQYAAHEKGRPDGRPFQFAGLTRCSRQSTGLQDTGTTR